MLTLKIQVPEARDRTAIAALYRDSKNISQGFAAASASQKIAAARGNPQCDPLRAWGHPPLGTYRLINHQPSGRDRDREYGAHLLLFEPLSGPALQAQASGRVGILVYGGPIGGDKRLRRTQGGVRLNNATLGILSGALGAHPEVMLVIDALRKPPWWKFWASTPESPPLSNTELKGLSAPFDEMSIVLALMNGARRRVAGGGAADDQRFRDDDRRDNSYRDRSGSGSSSDADSFRGGGGQSGGGGASGGWDGAPATARGVDASGRIVAGAAVGVAAAAVAASAAAAATRDGASQLADGGSADGLIAGSFGDGGSSSPSMGSSTHTSTSTRY